MFDNTDIHNIRTKIILSEQGRQANLKNKLLSVNHLTRQNSFSYPYRLRMECMDNYNWQMDYQGAQKLKIKQKIYDLLFDFMVRDIDFLFNIETDFKNNLQYLVFCFKSKEDMLYAKLAQY